VLTTEVNYRNGEKNGEARSYHFSSAGEDWNGNIAVKGNYRNNKADGIWVTYYVNGQISAEIVFKEDRLEGYNKLYSENGESIPITEPNNFTNMIGKYEEKLGIINHWTPY
jgi:antitoxin component YwqK of YwqJK toxin-antitoxin module